MLELNMFDLVKGFAGVIDLVNTSLGNHHQRVAVIVDQVASRLALNARERHLALVSAMIHDLGVIMLGNQPDSLLFEKDMQGHSLAGFVMLRSCPLMLDEAKIVRYHHHNWRNIVELAEEERPLARLGNLIHLADSIDMCSRLHPELSKIVWMVEKGVPRSFEKQSAEAALDFLTSPGFSDIMAHPAAYLAEHPGPERILRDEAVTDFSKLFSHVIDSKSPFTATHTTGVAFTGRALHTLGPFGEKDRPTMFVAGLLHDIGKLGVPTELLEKPGPLDKEEFQKVKRHAALSLDILGTIPGFEKVAPWGALHHEKLNGKGYPDGLSAEAISPESRLMAVADITTALTEDRPYRAGLDEEKTMGILTNMTARGENDGDMVALLRDNYKEVNSIRREAQQEAADFFQNLTAEIKLLSHLAHGKHTESIASILNDN